MPDDFVVFSAERKTVFRYLRRGPDNWEKLIRNECRWDFHDNVGDESAKDAFDCGYNEIFFRHK